MMKEKTFNTPIFHTSPFAFSANEFWDTSARQAKDVVLTNGLAWEYRISRMKLTIDTVSAFDADGNEHFLEDFPSYAELHPKGIETAFDKSMTRSLQLPEGTYTVFRFYLAEGCNRFVLADGREEALTYLEPLDFRIQHGLEIDGAKNPTVRMRFDFEPLSLSSYLRPLLGIFGKSKAHPGRLAQSLGS
jgi:hypothetical protein